MSWSVEDSYNKIVYRGRTLRECGVWIDPVFGIDFSRKGLDRDRITFNSDGSYTVQMYEGPSGMGGTLTVRKETR